MVTAQSMRHRPLIERAIKALGSQQKLADAIGLSQQGVSYLLNDAPRVRAEIAVAIERATKGKISKKELRPDIFGGP
jgi:DNA-binding transcriptional regulator YdaS (Cro superfamily)